MRIADLNLVACHKIPSRSFFYKGKQFPVCARCTGIHIGYLSFPLFTFNVITLNIFFTIALILPTLIDGFTQAYFNRESNNVIRVTTGFLSGVGQMSLVAIIGKSIGLLILKII